VRGALLSFVLQRSSRITHAGVERLGKLQFQFPHSETIGPLSYRATMRRPRDNAIAPAREPRHGITLPLLLQVLSLQQHAFAVPFKPQPLLHPAVGRAARGGGVPGASLRRTQRSTGPDPQPCFKAKKEILRKMDVGVFVTQKERALQCDDNGLFSPVQWWPGTGEQWCVDVHTNEEVDGTLLSPTEVNQQRLTPQACLALAHPPDGELLSGAACQIQGSGSAAACDDKCWWNHCRTQVPGYCPACREGTKCAPIATAVGGFVLGSCAVRQSVCADDPDGILAAAGLSCGHVLTGGLCADDLGVMFPLLFTGPAGGDQVCPLTCDPNSCESAPSPSSPSPQQGGAGGGADVSVNPVAHLALSLESAREQAVAVTLAGDAINLQFCFGCWTAETHTCHHISSTASDQDSTQDGITEQSCLAQGGVWQDLPDADHLRQWDGADGHY